MFSRYTPCKATHRIKPVRRCSAENHGLNLAVKQWDKTTLCRAWASPPPVADSSPWPSPWPSPPSPPPSPPSPPGGPPPPPPAASRARIDDENIGQTLDRKAGADSSTCLPLHSVMKQICQYYHNSSAWKKLICQKNRLGPRRHQTEIDKIKSWGYTYSQAKLHSGPKESDVPFKGRRHEQSGRRATR